MKINDLIDLIGGYEGIRVVDEEHNEIVSCVAIDLPTDVRDKFIKSIYTKNGRINIVALDKFQRRWYNKEKRECGVAKR